MNFSKMEAQRNKRLNDIVDVLEKSEMGSEDHDSTQEPFFGIGETRAFSQDHTLIPDLPEGLNHNFRHLYEIVGNPKVEVHLQRTRKHGDETYKEMWTIMSLQKALKIYNEYKGDGQERVFDIAFTYMGMGHINVLACDLDTHNLFIHPAGGANGYERENFYKMIVEYERDRYEQFYFTQWFNEFKA